MAKVKLPIDRVRGYYYWQLQGEKLLFPYLLQVNILHTLALIFATLLSGKGYGLPSTDEKTQSKED